MNEITRNPLCWPDNVARRAPHQRGNPQFNERSLSRAASFVLQEINRLNNRSWNHSDSSVIISSNLRLKQDGAPYSAQGEPADSGVAVYFTLRIRRNGKIIERPIVLTCDKWRKTADNLYAIGKDINAQRARERWGCGNVEQTFRGYLAIAEKCGGAAWWNVLNIQSSAGKTAIEAAYKSLAKKFHPDAGGSQEQFLKIQEAYEQAMGAQR